MKLRIKMRPTKLLLKLILLILLKSNLVENIDESRVLFGPGGSSFISCNVPKVAFNCVSCEVEAKCECQNNKNLALSLNSPAYLSVRREVMDRGVTKLLFRMCSFDDIEPGVFTRLDLSDLSLIVFDQFRILGLNERSLTFLSSNVTVVIKGSGKANNELTIPKGTFGRTVTNIVFESVKLNNFSTEAFVGMSASGSVYISKSIIDGALTASGTILETLALDEIVFKGVQFEDVVKPMINLVATTVRFEDSRMKLVSKGSVFVEWADRLEFDRCHISLYEAETIEATANVVSFVNTEFEQPQQNCLMGLVGSDEDAWLTLNNITIKDPSKGTLLTQFPNVFFENITVDRCTCDIVMHLFDGQIPVTNKFLPSLTPQELSLKLHNESNCQYNHSVVVPIADVCPRFAPLDLFEDPVNVAVVGILGAVIVLIATVVSCVVYKYYSSAKKRYEVVKKWTLAFPSASSYREPSVVQFDLEQVQYISRPTSAVFNVDSSVGDEWLRNQIINNVNVVTVNDVKEEPIVPPDLKENGVEHEQPRPLSVIPEEDEDEEDEVEEAAMGKFRFLRTKTKIMRRRQSKKSLESKRGSVIVHEGNNEEDNIK